MSSCADVGSFIGSKTSVVQTSNVDFTSEVSDYLVMHTGPADFTVTPSMTLPFFPPLCSTFITSNRRRRRIITTTTPTSPLSSSITMTMTTTMMAIMIAIIEIMMMVMVIMMVIINSNNAEIERSHKGFFEIISCLPADYIQLTCLYCQSTVMSKSQATHQALITCNTLCVTWCEFSWSCKNWLANLSKYETFNAAC